MNEDQRRLLAELLSAALRTRFEGNKKAAYTEIGINPATFDRALNALPIRDDRAARIVNELWPGAQGDVRNVSLDEVRPDAFHITTPPRRLSAREELRRASMQWIAQAPEAFRERITDWVQDLESRVEALERAALEQMSEPSDTTDDLIAADEQVQSISGEQLEPDTP